MTIQWINGGLVDIGILPDGKLLIVLTSYGWAEQDTLKEQVYLHGITHGLYNLFEELTCNGWDFDTCDAWGNMSTAPALTNVLDIPDDFDPEYPGGTADHFWYNPQYCIQDEIEEIYSKGYLIWDYWSMM